VVIRKHGRSPFNRVKILAASLTFNAAETHSALHRLQRCRLFSRCTVLIYAVSTDQMPSYRLSRLLGGSGWKKFCTLAADGIVAPTRYIAKQAIVALGVDLNVKSSLYLQPNSFFTQSSIAPACCCGRSCVLRTVRKGLYAIGEACRRL
jgi:hypothetical protein